MFELIFIIVLSLTSNNGTTFAYQQDDTSAEVRKFVAQANALEVRKLVAQANAFFEAGQNRMAISYYMKANRIDPTYAVVYYNYGMVYAKLGWYEKAQECFRKYLTFDSCSIPGLESLANVLYAQALYDEAIEVWRKVLSLEPDNAVVHLNIGIALFFLGEAEAAADHYEKAIELRSDYTEAVYRLGQVLATRGDLKEAFRRLKEAIKTDSTHASSYYTWSMTLFLDGQISKAVKKLKKAIEFDPDNAGYHYTLALMLLEPGVCRSIEGAKEEFETAHKLNPNYVVPVIKRQYMDWEINTYRW